MGDVIAKESTTNQTGDIRVRTKAYVAVLGLIVMVGAGLRVWQFASNPSLWLDEAAIAVNVYDRSFYTLLTAPLDFEQTAPKGFLFAEKTTVALLGNTDYALRLFPFLCSIAALVVFAALCDRILPRTGGLAATALFALAAPLLYVTTQAKQYSTDVLASTCFLLLAATVNEAKVMRSRTMVAILGALLPWFSQPAAIVAVGLVAALTVGTRKERRLSLMPILAIWLVSAAAAAFVAVDSVTPHTRDYLNQFWTAGFAPRTWAEETRSWWPLDRVKLFVGPAVSGFPAALNYPVPYAYAACSALGVLLLAMYESQVIALVVAAPVLATLAASITHQYPFSDRAILFLLPCLLCGIGAFAALPFQALRSRFAGLLTPLIIVLPAVYVIVRTPPPYQSENVKPVLHYIESQRTPDDRVYVYYGGVPAVEVYAPQLRLDETAYLAGRCHRGQTPEYLEEVDTFRGHSRVWVIFVHALSLYRERDDLVAYLDVIGSRRAHFAVPPHRVGGLGGPAEAFLYDLSNQTKLRAASSRTFPVTAKGVRGAFGCIQGPQAIAPKHLTQIDVPRS